MWGVRGVREVLILVVVLILAGLWELAVAVVITIAVVLRFDYSIWLFLGWMLRMTGRWRPLESLSMLFTCCLRVLCLRGGDAG